MSFPKHCSDDELVASLDGETPFWNRLLVRRHLNACWECRARQLELEQQAHSIARTLKDPWFPPVSNQRRARENFEFWRTGYEAERSASLRRRGSLWLTAAAAALAAVAVVIIWNWRAPAISASTALRTAMRQEAGVLATAGPVEQRLDLETEELLPVRRKQRYPLVILSDGARNRLAVEWRREDGSNRLSLYRAHGKEWVHDSVQGQIRLRTASLARPIEDLARDLRGPASPEQALERWIETNCWQPLALTRDMMLLSGARDATLSIERRTEAGGTPYLHLVAQRRVDGVSMEMTADLEEGSLRPKRHSLVLDSSSRIIRIRIQSLRTVAPAVVAWPSELDADPVILAGISPDGARPASARPGPDGESLPAGPSAAEIASAEVRILHALWYADSWKQSQVSTRRTETGLLAVRILALSADGKPRIQQALSQLHLPRWAHVEVLRPEEILAENPRAEIIHPIETREAVNTGRSWHLAEALTARGGSLEGLAETARLAVTSSEITAQEAHALRSLAERYQHGVWRRVPEADLRLLQSMVQDSLTALSQALQTQSARTLPTLQFLAPGRPESVNVSSHSGDWVEQGIRISALVDRLHARNLQVFAFTAGSSPIAASELEGIAREEILTLLALRAQLSDLSSKLSSAFQVKGDLP
jgi:hypothetical protein